MAVCVDVPPSYETRARYALRMLLLPLGLEPRWVRRCDLGGPALYYGARADALPPFVLALTYAPDAAVFFGRNGRYDVDAVRWQRWEGRRWPVLFGVDDRPDLVASAFFWLSGWQEYTTPYRDAHGRFPHSASLQYRWDTTIAPVVDVYRAWLGDQLEAHGIRVRYRTWKGVGWAFCPTHDIDYLRKWRPGMIYRESVEYLLGNRLRRSPGERLRRFGTFLRDWLRPGDVYRLAFERMHREVKQRGGTATYFVKTGAHGDHDVYYAPGRYLRRRLDRLEQDGFEIGLHPSYHAHAHPEYLAEERERLAALTRVEPVSVRQHYLRYDWPATPRLHEATGFRIDSTLGFAEHEGFRHGTCLPFQVYDLKADRPLEVWEMPPAFMESALFNRRGLSLEEAKRATVALLDVCRRFGGVAVGLWHNVLWDELDHPGWGEHFLSTLNEAVRRGAYVGSLRDVLDSWLGDVDP